MPLPTAPLLPGSSPLPEPGRRPPDGRALRLGALAMLPVLLVALVAGPLGLSRLSFMVAGVQAQATGGIPNNASAQFQGFVYNWVASDKGGGYTTSASLQNMRSEADWFHMNAVIIPVVADMFNRSEANLLWHAGKGGNHDTLPESDYEQAIKDAKAAGLVPILELQVRQYDPLDSLDGGDNSADLVGKVWANAKGEDNFKALGGAVNHIEKGWFDNYTAFASEYARLSQKYQLPYFIIGDGLSDVTTDGPNTTAKADPASIDHGVPGESFPTCSGRRDCEWRHVVHAIRSPLYANYAKHASYTGGSYTGKLIYAANWKGAPVGDTNPEFEHITWWDAVNIIGIDAYFALSQNSADLSVTSLQSSWNGKTTCTGNLNVCPRNIVQRLADVSSKYGRPVLFTAAGYASYPGANSSPVTLAGENILTSDSVNMQNVDNQEQLSDMQALLETFNGLPWWSGVFWNGDRPQAPRSSQARWAVSSNWAGDSLAKSKPAGQWLATYYKANPLN